MASLTTQAIPALMNIVALMASITTGWGRQFYVICRLGVAILTFDFLMATVKLVLGSLVMIKVPDCPIAGVMARLAFLAQAQLVLVFLLVARIAIRL